MTGRLLEAVKFVSTSVESSDYCDLYFMETQLNSFRYKSVLTLFFTLVIGSHAKHYVLVFVTSWP